MGSCQPFVDDEPFDKRVKTLADNELLEIWEETQQLGVPVLTEDEFAEMLK